MLAMAAVSIWGIANGLGTSSLEMNPDQLKVQAQVGRHRTTVFLLTDMMNVGRLLWLLQSHG